MLGHFLNKHGINEVRQRSDFSPLLEIIHAGQLISAQDVFAV